MTIDAPPVLEIRGVTKTFPGVIANEDISFTLGQGEIHCLLGENGAGKTTLMKIVFGLYQPDAGEVLVRGEPVRFTSSADAIAKGIGMVHQHFQLIPVFTVAENVVLGNEIARRGMLDMDEARRRIRDLEKRYGLSVDPDAYVSDLSIGEQQRVELIKALYREADILILDEPTAVLTPAGDQGVLRGGSCGTSPRRATSVIFITHKLQRGALEIADRVTVLRRRTSTSPVPDHRGRRPTQSLANASWSGRDVVLDRRQGTSRARRAEVLASITDLRRPPTSASVVRRSDGLVARPCGPGRSWVSPGLTATARRELIDAITGLRHQGVGAASASTAGRSHGASPHDAAGGHRAGASATSPTDRHQHGAWSARLLARREHRADPRLRQGTVLQVRGALFREAPG